MHYADRVGLSGVAGTGFTVIVVFLGGNIGGLGSQMIRTSFET